MSYVPSAVATSVTVLQFLLFVAFSSLVQNGCPSAHQVLYYVPVGLYAASTITQVVSFALSYICGAHDNKYADNNFGTTATNFGLLLYTAGVIYTVVGAITVQLTDIEPLFQCLIIAGISSLVLLASTRIIPQIDQLEKVACNDQIKVYTPRLVLIEIFAFGLHRLLVNSRILHSGHISVILLVALSIVLAVVLYYTKQDHKNWPCQQSTGEPQQASHETNTRKPCSDSHPCEGNPLLQKCTAMCTSQPYLKDTCGEQRASDKQNVSIWVVIYFFIITVVINGHVLLLPITMNVHILQKEDTDALTLLDDLPPTLLNNLLLIVAVASILIYQLTFSHYNNISLKKMGVGITLLSVSTSFALLTASGYQIDPTIAYSIKDPSQSVPQQNVVIQVSIANLVNIVACLLLQIGGLEYICDDSPKEIKVPLLATFWSTRSLLWYVVLVGLVWNGTPVSTDTPVTIIGGTEYFIACLAMAILVIFACCINAHLYMCSGVRQKAADLELESAVESSIIIIKM